jgi:hypothetical protein
MAAPMTKLPASTRGLVTAVMLGLFGAAVPLLVGWARPGIVFNFGPGESGDAMGPAR